MENFIFNFKKIIKKNINNKKIKAMVNFTLILISFGILFYFCFQNNHLLNLSLIFPNLNQLYLQMAFLCMILSWYFDSMVLKNLVYETYQKKYKKILFFKITMIGQYFTSLTPLGIAAQPMQILELKKYGIDKNTAASLLLRKFFIYQSCLLISSIVSSIIYFCKIKTGEIGYLCPLVITGIIFQGFIILVTTLFSINKNLTMRITKISIKILHKAKIIKSENEALDKFTKTLDKFINNNKKLCKNKKLNIKLYVFTSLQVTLSFLITFFIFKAFHHSSFPIIDITCTQSVTTTISSFTPLPGSAGTAESTFLTLFKQFFYEYEITEAMILFRFINFYFALIIGFIFYKIKIKNFQK